MDERSSGQGDGKQIQSTWHAYTSIWYITLDRRQRLSIADTTSDFPSWHRYLESCVPSRSAPLALGNRCATNALSGHTRFFCWWPSRHSKAVMVGELGRPEEIIGISVFFMDGRPEDTVWPTSEGLIDHRLQQIEPPRSLCPRFVSLAAQHDDKIQPRQHHTNDAERRWQIRQRELSRHRSPLRTSILTLTSFPPPTVCR